MNYKTARAMLGTSLFERYDTNEDDLLNISDMSADCIRLLRFLTACLREDDWETSLGWNAACDRIIADLEAIYVAEPDGDDEPAQED